MLTSPVQEGSTIVVVASRGGDDSTRPGSSTCATTPTSRSRIKGAPKQNDAGPGRDSEERARLWPLVTADHKNYAGYQTKTTREIPLVLLEP